MLFEYNDLDSLFDDELDEDSDENITPLVNTQILSEADETKEDEKIPDDLFDDADDEEESKDDSNTEEDSDKKEENAEDDKVADQSEDDMNKTDDTENSDSTVEEPNEHGNDLTDSETETDSEDGSDVANDIEAPPEENNYNSSDNPYSKERKLILLDQYQQLIGICQDMSSVFSDQDNSNIKKDDTKKNNELSVIKSGLVNTISRLEYVIINKFNTFEYEKLLSIFYYSKEFAEQASNFLEKLNINKEQKNK